MGRKLLYLLFLFLGLTQISNAQSEYGLLFISNIDGRTGNEMYDGFYEIGFPGNSLYIPPNGSYDFIFGREDFFYVNPDLATKKINFTLYSEHRECQIRESVDFDIKTPSDHNSIFFVGCYANSTFHLIHLSQPEKTQYCPLETIELENGWNWSYKIDDLPWGKFPISYQNNPKIAFKISDLPEYNEKSKIIQIQTGYKTQYTNIITYEIIPCSPKIESISDKNFTSCIYSKDGNVNIQFKRDLAENESFVFNFYTTDNVLIPNPPVSYDKNTRMYTFSGLAQGDYYLKYQTFMGGQQTSVNEQPYPKFTISPPSQFKFDIIETQPACHNEQGMIKIQASGGTSPYYYSIDSRPEIEFNSSTGEIIMPDGVYSVKVTDTKGCIEK